MASTKSRAHLAPAAIEAAWTDLWSKQHAGPGAFGRAHTQTLVVLAHQPSKALDATLAQVSQSHPGRIVVLYLSARVRAADHVALCGSPEAGLGSELVAVTADAPVGDHWAELVLPLLLPDVPVYLFIADTEVLEAPELTSLVETVDHVVLDTAGAERPWEPWRPLFQHEGDLGLLDLAWIRTAGWREALAAAFDPEPCLALLDTLASVTVAGSQAGSALWLAAWLANRLDYRPDAAFGAGQWARRHRPPVAFAFEPRARGGLDRITLRFAEAEAVVRHGDGTVLAEVRRGSTLLATAELPRVGQDTAPQLSAALAEGFDPLFADAFRWLDLAYPRDAS